MKIAFDFGFGWTKVCVDTPTGIQCIKFPSWLAYHSNSSISEVDRVVFDGKEYVVGFDAKYERQKITITSMRELLNYFPLFKKYALTRLGINEHDIEQIITGIPPSQKQHASILEAQNIKVVPQGVGIYLDTISRSNFEDVEDILVIDIGYNTVDYLLVTVKDSKKKKGNSIEKMGVERMIELFRDKLPDEISYIKQLSLQRLMEIFEKGYVNLEGEKINLSNYKNKAIDEYNEILKTRLYDEIKNLIDEVELLTLAGGGAYYIDNIRKAGVFVPEEPEFSQARGYLLL